MTNDTSTNDTGHAMHFPEECACGKPAEITVEMIQKVYSIRWEHHEHRQPSFTRDCDPATHEIVGSHEYCRKCWAEDEQHVQPW